MTDLMLILIDIIIIISLSLVIITKSPDKNLVVNNKLKIVEENEEKYANLILNVKNNMKEPVFILLPRRFSSYLDIKTEKGEIISYVGPLPQMVAPTKRDYIQLKPDQEMESTIKIKITNNYNIQAKEKYSIIYRGVIVYFIGSYEENRQEYEIKSEPIYFKY